MSLFRDLISRAEEYLQDKDHDFWSRDRIRIALVDSAARLARAGFFGEVIQLKAKADQGIYDETDDIPAGTCQISAVSYDGRTLRETDERTLARHASGWERARHGPQYWTSALQGMTQLRIAPVPLEDGSTLPIFPPYPLLQPIEKNLLVFLDAVPLTPETPEDVDTNIPEPLEEIMVFDAVGTLTDDEAEHQDMAKSAAFTQLAMLFQRLLGE